MPAAVTCTRTSPSCATGAATSCSSSTSGPPKRFTCIALIGSLSVGERRQRDTSEHQMRPAVAAELRPRQSDARTCGHQALELVRLQLSVPGRRRGLASGGELDDRAEDNAASLARPHRADPLLVVAGPGAAA